jgi:hypothetical protein
LMDKRALSSARGQVIIQLLVEPELGLAHQPIVPARHSKMGSLGPPSSSSAFFRPESRCLRDGVFTFRVAPFSVERRRTDVGVVDAELELGGPRAGHLRTRDAELGFGFPCLSDPGNPSVITSGGLGDPAKSGFWEGAHGDDRGGSWDLSAVICETRCCTCATLR